MKLHFLNKEVRFYPFGCNVNTNGSSIVITFDDGQCGFRHKMQTIFDELILGKFEFKSLDWLNDGFYVIQDKVTKEIRVVKDSFVIVGDVILYSFHISIEMKTITILTEPEANFSISL